MLVGMCFYLLETRENLVCSSLVAAMFCVVGCYAFR